MCYHSRPPVEPGLIMTSQAVSAQPNLFDRLKEIVGPAGYREGDDIEPKNFQDLMEDRAIRPPLLLRPASTEEVSAILALCHGAGQPVAPQGGMTGLVSGAAPLANEICLSLERMNKVVELDPYTSTITVEAGVPLQVIQERVDEQGLLFPLDLGARGSCTIGGNLSTNAGGNRVIRYGMTRDLTVGLEAVLADGTVIDNLHKLRKNNTGYDIKQLFIGSEGTLGVITRAVLKLFPRPASQAVAMCGLPSFRQVADLLVHAQARLGANLSAFEVLWRNTYQLVDAHVPHASAPLPNNHAFYVLVESMGSDEATDSDLFLDMLDEANRKGLIEDVVVADSPGKIKKLWTVRDAAAEIAPGVGYLHTYDVSLNVADMSYFGDEVERRLRQRWPDAILGLFGHIGDGNLHIVINVGPETRALHLRIDEVIYGLIQELKGSVSAEHGIGIMKRPFLPYSRGGNEIALMRNLKQNMDPRGILNPGRIFT